MNKLFSGIAILALTSTVALAEGTEKSSPTTGSATTTAPANEMNNTTAEKPAKMAKKQHAAKKHAKKKETKSDAPAAAPEGTPAE